MNTKTILHITPHLGCGVGHVVLNYLSNAKKKNHFLHSVACLDYANQHAIEVAKNLKVSLFDNMAWKKQELLEMITDFDLILIHTWNHPLLYDFLVREKLPASRIIMWGHNNGFHAPCVFTKKVLTYPDLFVFTTPASFKIKDVQNLSDEEKKSLRVIISTGGVQHVISVKPKEHSGFNVGYIGTVDYTKMHPDFLKICDQVEIPNVKFIVCGGPKEKEIKEEAENLGIGAKFNFEGQIPNIKEYLALFDVFGYPLAPYHYGTGEQVLQESMAAGVVPVVLNNYIESYLVKDGLTGIVAENKDEYIKALENLYHDVELRNYLSQNAKEYALRTFSLDKLIDDWENIFNEVLLNFPKTIKKWNISKEAPDLTPSDIFLEALGDYGESFIFYCNAENDEEKKIAIEKIKKLGESANWQAKTRSTVHHYNYFFPDDRYLSIWSQLMKESEYLLKKRV